MPKYIVEKTNSNPKILERKSDGTYETIAFAAGDSNLANVIKMVENANNYLLSTSS